MKKVLIGISGLAVLAFILVLTISAQDQKADNVKPEAEAVEAVDCGSCPGHGAAAAPDCSMDVKTGADCDHEKCTECTCDPGTCDGNCSENCDDCEEKCEMAGMENCDPAMCHK